MERIVVITKSVGKNCFVSLDRKLSREEAKAVIDGLKKELGSETRFIWSRQVPKGPGRVSIVTIDVEVTESE